ncbi:hypothetical protein HYC85_000726 [Camellia sinensis]|uniref:Alpha-taxilin n=1 Tax=Camellia sinensis TaxID=4442 RepID=A0A7J7I4G7_CAMSI|nr:hypothetical protein HYC85_000726 [Camellia sinensis]
MEEEDGGRRGGDRRQRRRRGDEQRRRLATEARRRDRRPATCEMENPVADQLPDAHSLPDGFVDSSAEPLAQEKPLIDYKEEKLVELDSRPELVVVVNEGKTEKNEKSRRFPVPLSENDGSDASKELELPIEGWSEQSDCTSAMPELRESDEKCQSSEKGCILYLNYFTFTSAIEGTLETQAAHMKETSSTENAENNVKIETSKVKRKNTKRTCKSEKEFLEFTLKYQQVLAERDTAITVRDKLESLCRELQRQNKMLMDECKRVSTEGQNLRLDLSSKFRDAIKEVSNKLEEQKGDSMSQLKENEMLRSNLKQLADQYALSEQQYEQKLKQKTLELQLADLKMQQQGEKLLQEQSQMMLYAEQVSQLLATEKNLRLQLTADGEKFQQFQVNFIP